MQLEHEFVVPVPRAEAWAVLLDVRQVAPCMPGATLLNVDGDTFTGRVKVKVGPITVAYRGSAEFTERDDADYRAVLKATGREERGAGTAAATVTARLTELDAGRTKVAVLTDLDITGKPAQFGRGVLEEVGSAIIGQFAERLAEKIDTGPAASPDTQAPTDVPGTAADAADDTGSGEVLDLGSAAWRPVAERLAPVALALVTGFLFGGLTRRRTRPAVTVVLAGLPASNSGR